jgi:hypothetical protein
MGKGRCHEKEGAASLIVGLKFFVYSSGDHFKDTRDVEFRDSAGSHALRYAFLEYLKEVPDSEFLLFGLEERNERVGRIYIKSEIVQGKQLANYDRLMRLG